MAQNGPATDAGGVLVTLACMAIVALYAYNRYNAPPENRLTTTRSLFYRTGACYVISSLAVFFGLSEVVLRPGVLSVLGLGSEQQLTANLSAPLMSAIILTTLLPNAIWVRDVDKFLLKLFQDWGRIPTGVSNLANRIPQDALAVRPQDIQELRTWIIDSGDLPDDLADHLGTELETPGGRMTRVMRLYKEIEKLGQLAAYVTALSSGRLAWQVLQADGQIFLQQSHAYFILFDSLKLNEAQVVKKALNQARMDYEGRCKAIYQNLAEFLAQIMIRTQYSDEMIDRQLNRIGYAVDPGHGLPPPVGPFIFIAVVLLVTILGMAAVWPQQVAAGTLPLAVSAVLIAATKAVGAAAAVLPKLEWQMFRREPNGDPPYKGWIVAALTAAAISFVLERGAVALVYQSVDVIGDFAEYPMTPLAPTSFFICCAVQILCDYPLPLKAGLTRRGVEAAICGAVMLATVFACIRLLGWQAPTAFPFVVSTLLGLVIGFFAPHFYRQATKAPIAASGPISAPMPQMG